MEYSQTDKRRSKFNRRTTTSTQWTNNASSSSRPTHTPRRIISSSTSVSISCKPPCCNHALPLPIVQPLPLLPPPPPHPPPRLFPLFPPCLFAPLSPMPLCSPRIV